MQRTMTMKDIAKMAGVSVMTVSRALKEDASVSAKTREEIVRIAEEFGYVFDSSASNLRSQRSGFVAVTIPSLNNANFANTVTALSEELARSGRQVLLGYTNYSIAEEEARLEKLMQRKPEAIVVTGGRHSDRARRFLKNTRIPVVETWDLPSDPIGHVVGFSNADAMELLVDHLLSTGRSKIAFIGGDADGDTRGAHRRRGFNAAMERRGLDPTRLVRSGKPPISMVEGAESMARLFADMPDTEAVICVSDLSAFGALTECQRRGIAVPDDMAIAGFGAYEIAGICHPTITTIDPKPQLIGRRTAELLQLALEEDPATRPLRIEIQPKLVLGGSTGRT